MYKKIAILGISALLLGGCTLRDVFKTGTAVKDEKTLSTTVSSPVPVATPDSSLEAMPSTTTSTDVDSLEKDINNTKILDEDLSGMN